jgi:oxygen-independent coproporphyrinogen III oxidase
VSAIDARQHARHLYIHVPFCARRCSYCDFAIAVRRTVPVDEYVDALTREFVLRSEAGTGVGELDTIYLGGGTPSRLGGDGVARVFELVRERCAVAEGAECTIEVNPEDVSPENVRGWYRAGVNRASLGVQSFDPGVLTWMHRSHSVAQVRSATDLLREGGIDALSVDLIFALPESLHRDWEADLTHALSLAPDHLSVYGLTVEPATPLGRWTARGEVSIADEDRYAREFLSAHDRLTGAGFDHYEVSNYARHDADRRHHARHNSAYWRRVPYLALGPGAHGFDGVTRWWNLGAYTHWKDALAKGQLPVEGSERPDDNARLAEEVYLGMRTNGGIALSDTELPVVEEWVAAGWGTVVTGERFVPSAEGWLRLDALAASLTSLRSRCEL